MSDLVVVNHVSLDGVYQSPAAPDEDTRGGFKYGGWAAEDNDEVMLKRMGEGMKGEGALLLGRRTYEHFAAVWPHMPEDNPYTTTISNARKYVASKTLKEPLEWNNSVVLEGDAAEAVAKLKTETHMTVLGSGELIQTLMQHELVDEFLLCIHPVALGSGRRLFTEKNPMTSLKLTDSTTTTKGVVMATYEVERST